MKNSSCISKNPITFLLLVGILFFSQIQSGLAHSPASVSLAYNKSSSVLTVSITHTVEDKTTHYINEIQIYVNNTLINTTSYTSQPTNSQFVYNFTVMADTGAVIKAIVKCNVAGQTTKELTVSGENETGSPSTPQNPAEPESQQQITGYALLIPIACIWALFEIKKTLKKRVLSN